MRFVVYPLVSTTSGILRGQVEDGLSVFLGIPYAEPPVKERRWRPPMALTNWDGVRDALSPGPAAMQLKKEGDPDSANFVVQGPISEDCLYLNVWTPSIEDKLPVMVWIHGGSYASGSGFMKLSHPRHICRRDTVVVTINYRLGPFGFCHLDSVTGGDIPAVGNEGLLDQAAALKWVRENISSFGGDSQNVTVFGCSSGGASIASLMAMPSAKRLFDRAIVQSGGDYRFQHTPKNNIDWFVKPMMRRLGTQKVPDLMSAPAEDILNAWSSIEELLKAPWDFRFPGQVIDGTVLPCAHEKALTEGSADGIALMSGSTLDEYAEGARYFFHELNLEGLVDVLASRLNSEDQVRNIVECYRASREKRGDSADFTSVLVAILNQKAELVPSNRLLDAQRDYGPVYSYIFDWMSPPDDEDLGAYHGLDVAYLFGNHRLLVNKKRGLGPVADALSEGMIDAWTSFAKSGNPSSAALGHWPEYDAASRSTMIIGANSRVAYDPYGEEIHLWDAIPTESPMFQHFF